MRTTLIALGVLLAATGSSVALPLNPLETACAAEAASPFEPGLETTGRQVKYLDVQRALDTCWAAMRTGGSDCRINAWMARAYYAAGQFGAAFYFADRAARNDSPLGLYVAGILYSNGDGVARDAEKGFDLLMASANAGFVPAYQAVAISLINGTGVPAAPGQAVELLQYAADEGFGPAAATLAQMYFQGVGVPKDDVEAARLLRLAALYGEAEE